jgi:hypothetical protein
MGLPWNWAAMISCTAGKPLSQRTRSLPGSPLRSLVFNSCLMAKGSRAILPLRVVIKTSKHKHEYDHSWRDCGINGKEQKTYGSVFGTIFLDGWCLR